MKNKISRFIIENAKVADKWLRKNQRMLLMISGLTSFGVTIIESCKATPKAIEDYNATLKETGSKPKAVLKASKNYIYPAATGALATGCVIGSYATGSAEIQKLSALLSVSESTRKAFLEVTEKELGREKTSELQKEANQEVIEKIKASSDGLNGTMEEKILCKDEYSGRFFMSTDNEIQAAVNEVNKSLLHNNNASLNEYYYHFEDLDEIDAGETHGWNMDTDFISVVYGSGIDKKGRPYLSVSFRIEPYEKFDQVWR